MNIDATGAAALLEGLADRGALVVGDTRAAVGGAGSYPHHDPSTGRLQVQVPLADAADVDRAVAAARAALPVWRRLSLARRGGGHPHAPRPRARRFGGVKRSGFGREGGRAGIEEDLRPKNVFIGW